jgi:hypothetical protein
VPIFIGVRINGNTMKSKQDKLERIKSFALKQLMASKGDAWSYLDDAPGMESFSFCRWSDVDDEAWDGDTSWLRGEVCDERLLALTNPEADLTEAEEAIWRRHLAHWTASQSDSCRCAVLIPVRLRGKGIHGYALFVVGQHHPYETPAFEGAFETRDDVIEHLEGQGALALPDCGRIHDPPAALQ